MTSALSSAYVLLGKATMSDPPDWSTAVGAIHTLTSLLKCSKCNQSVGPRPRATPLDSYSLLCDKCSTEPSQDSEILNLLMENIKNLCSYTLRAFQNVPKLEVDTDDDEKSETEDIVIVPPTHTSQAKFCQKLRKFAKNNFGLQLETPQTPPKPVIVTSPAKNWIKLQQNKKKHNGHVMINGAKMARDQIVKTTLRPSLTCPFKTNSDFVVKLGELPTAKVTLTDINKKVNTGNGCRCGNATSNPGKLTCGGQRCPCYTNAKSCIECKCKGCRNPHQANGIKVIRPHLQLKNKKIFIGPGANPPLVSSSQNHPNSMTTIRRIHLN